MTTRILPPAEWHKLAGTGLDMLSTLTEAPTSPIVVEDNDGKVIACWGLVNVVHAEGMWVDPMHRAKPGTMRALIRAMRQEAKARGLVAVWTTSRMQSITELLGHAHALPVDGEHFVIPVEIPPKGEGDYGH